jgi:RNA polymerase sigma factor (sigma-70 family)
LEASALTPSGALSGIRGPSPLLRLQSDEKLIELTRHGQHAAFEALCARYESRLLAFCRHMLASREDAEDVLQEVFAAAFNAMLADGRPINARPWLYRIARNRSLNHLRRASAIGVDSMDVHFADHGMSTSDRALKRESFRELLYDVGQLPETQRTALLLREIDALSYEQIADAMETTVPSVKSLLVRARISLAEAAEARKLSCEEVRLELGNVAEGLLTMTPPVRRHVRDCDRCRFFKRQLRENNKALAAIFPVAPLLLLKKLVLAKLGATASAGSAQVAGGAGATVGATAGAGVLATAGGATGAAGAGSALTVGAGAIASKAVAGLAAAALVGAGAVAANHLTVAPAAKHHASHPYAAGTSEASSAPVVVGERAQPVTLTRDHAALLARRARTISDVHRAAKVTPSVQPPAGTPAVPVTSATVPAAGAATQAAQPAQPAQPQPSETQVTQVTSDTTQLPPQATSPPTTATPPTTTSAPTTASPPTITTTTTTEMETTPAMTTPAMTTPATTTPPGVEAPPASSVQPAASPPPQDTAPSGTTTTSTTPSSATGAISPPAATTTESAAPSADTTTGGVAAPAAAAPTAAVPAATPKTLAPARTPATRTTTPQRSRRVQRVSRRTSRRAPARGAAPRHHGSRA